MPDKQDELMAGEEKVVAPEQVDATVLVVDNDALLNVNENDE